MSPARTLWPMALLAIAACWSTSSLARTDAPPPPPGGPMNFKQMDNNGDGIITRDEFNAAQPGHDGQSPGNGPDQGMPPRPPFSGSDTSDMPGDHMPPPPPGMNQGMGPGPSRFSDLDRNGDGSLSMDEFKAAQAQMPPPPPGMNDHQGSDHAPKMPGFSDLDRNKDGKLSEQEFANARPQPPHGQHGPQGSNSPMQDAPHPPRFEDLDSNGDGRVTKEEFDRASKQHRPPEMPHQ